MKTFLLTKKMLWLIVLLWSVSAYGYNTDELAYYSNKGYSICIQNDGSGDKLMVYDAMNTPLQVEWPVEGMFGGTFDNLVIQSCTKDLKLQLQLLTLKKLTISASVSVKLRMMMVEITESMEVDEEAKVILEIESPDGGAYGLEAKRMDVRGELAFQPIDEYAVANLAANVAVLRLAEGVFMTERAVLNDRAGVIQAVTVGEEVIKKPAWKETMFLAEKADDKAYIPRLFRPVPAQLADLPAEKITLKKKIKKAEKVEWDTKIDNKLLKEMYDTQYNGLRHQNDDGKVEIGEEFCIETKIDNVLLTNYIIVRGALPAVEQAEKVVIHKDNEYKMLKEGEPEQTPATYFNGVVPAIKNLAIEIAKPAKEKVVEERELTLLNTEVTNLEVQENLNLKLIMQNLNKVKEMNIGNNSAVKIVPQAAEMAKPAEEDLKEALEEEILKGIEQANPLVTNNTLNKMREILKNMQNVGGLKGVETAVSIDETATLVDETGSVTQVARPTDEPDLPATPLFRQPAFPPALPTPANIATGMPAEMPAVNETLNILHELMKVSEVTGELEPVPNEAYSGIQKIKQQWTKEEQGGEENSDDEYFLSFTPPEPGLYRIKTTITEDDKGDIELSSPLFIILDEPIVNPQYHIVNLETGEGITANYSAGELTIEDGEHLFLQFYTDDPTQTAADILFRIDGVETAFTRSIDGRGGNYILNPIEKDHSIEIRLQGNIGDPDPNPDTTSNTTLMHGIRVSVENGELNVENETAGTVDLAIYTLTGKLYISRSLPQGSTLLSLPAGIYIVRAGEVRMKIII